MEKNISKVRAHDAIVGILYLSGVGLSYLTGNFSFLWIVIGVGFLQIISPFTKFCPVYFVLNKIMPDSDPIQDGKQYLNFIFFYLCALMKIKFSKYNGAGNDFIVIDDRKNNIDVRSGEIPS